MTSRAADVTVVGASTAGLVTALGLARAGVEVVLVDTAPAPRLSWTAVHHWSVLPLLEELGVLDQALVAGEATARWGLHVLASGEQLVFDTRDLGREVRHPFHLRLEPAVLRSLLRSALVALPRASEVTGVRVTGVRQQDGGAEVLLDGGPGVVRSRWVVGADGPASAVRREVGLGLEGTTWTERCVVALVEHDFGSTGYPDTTFQVDGRLGALVERVTGTRWRYLFQEPLSRDDDAAPRIQDVLHAVTGAHPAVLDWTSARMHQRSATSYRAGRVLLVGEAAHVTHPMSGHTSLSSWFDAATVAPALTEVLDGAPDRVLDTWAQRRRRRFLDDAAPLSLGRRHLLAQIRDAARLEVELEGFRRATADPALRREVLLGGLGGSLSDLSGAPPF